MNNLAPVALVAMLMTFVLGLVGLLIFWHLAKSRREQSGPAVDLQRWWPVVVGTATIISAIVAVSTYIRS